MFSIENSLTALEKTPCARIPWTAHVLSKASITRITELYYTVVQINFHAWLNSVGKFHIEYLTERSICGGSWDLSLGYGLALPQLDSDDLPK